MQACVNMRVHLFIRAYVCVYVCIVVCIQVVALLLIANFGCASLSFIKFRLSIQSYIFAQMLKVRFLDILNNQSWRADVLRIS